MGVTTLALIDTDSDPMSSICRFPATTTASAHRVDPGQVAGRHPRRPCCRAARTAPQQGGGRGFHGQQGGPEPRPAPAVVE